MFGSRIDYLSFFELTIPESLYVDWHRCFVFHRLALEAIREGLGSLVWLSDHRISAVASSSIDRATVDLNRGEMAFGLFKYDPDLENLIASEGSSIDTMDRVAELIGETAFPGYVRRYIRRVSPDGANSVALHPSGDISGYTDANGINKEQVTRKKGFFGNSHLQRSRYPKAVHHLKIYHNAGANARLVYKFVGNIQFIRNTSRDT